MLVSSKLISILKSLSTLNPNLYIDAESNEIATVKTGRVVLCRAVVDELFPVEFGIYKLNDFLGALSLFNEPDITFEDFYCMIKEAKDGRKKLKYFYADKSTLLLPPTKKIDIKDDDVIAEFTMTDEALRNIIRAASLMELDSIVIGIDDDRASIGAEKKSTGNEASNNYSLDISDSIVRGPAYKDGSAVTVHIDKLNVNPINGCDYNIRVAKHAIELDSVDGSEYNVTYWYSPMSKVK